VQIQNIGLTSTKYRELSRSQFKAAGLTVEADTDRNVSGKEATLWRYSGAGIRAIALAVFAGDQTFLVTCLAAAADFEKLESAFTKTIDSFSLEAK
jgi:surfactin synthase thioesterase subunit